MLLSWGHRSSKPAVRRSRASRPWPALCSEPLPPSEQGRLAGARTRGCLGRWSGGRLGGGGLGPLGSRYLSTLSHLRPQARKQAWPQARKQAWPRLGSLLGARLGGGLLSHRSEGALDIGFFHAGDTALDVNAHGAQTIQKLLVRQAPSPWQSRRPVSSPLATCRVVRFSPRRSLCPQRRHDLFDARDDACPKGALKGLSMQSPIQARLPSAQVRAPAPMPLVPGHRSPRRNGVAVQRQSQQSCLRSPPATADTLSLGLPPRGLSTCLSGMHGLSRLASTAQRRTSSSA